MMVYIIATLLMLFACYLTYPRKASGLDDQTYKKRKVISCLVSMLPLFLVMAMRWNVGVDTWYTYTPEYLAMKSESGALSEEEKQIMLECARLKAGMDYGYSTEQTQELTYNQALDLYSDTYHHTAIGFQALERLLTFLHADVQWLYVITSLIILGFTFATIWIQSEEPFFACLMFVITGSFFLAMNIVSQFMAISICLFACTFAEKRKPIIFLFFVALATSFHISALLILPVYYLPKLRLKPVWCVAIICGALVVAQIGFPLIMRLIEIIAPQYARHFSMEADFEWVFLALGLSVFAVSSYYYKDGKDKPYYRIWYYMNVIGLIALCFSGKIPLMKRINYYFAAPHFLFLPLAIHFEKRLVFRKTLTMAVAFLFILETVIAIGYLNKHETLPYKVFFQGDKVEMTISVLNNP